jgi:tetratricopeptide (TPR) repeat protein
MEEPSMNLRQYIVRLVISLLATMLIACTSGPAEKLVSESFSSPATLLDQGIHNYNISNYAAAINKFEKALLQYRSIDNQPGIANSCLNLATAYMAINNNQIAAEYLDRADAIIKQSKLVGLNEHLPLLKSSLAINNGLYDHAVQELDKVLDSKDTTIKLAALKNRTRIAFLRSDNDKLQWLEKYKILQKQNPDNQSHGARTLRFEAEASDDKDESVILLAKSLTISQELANRTAIAATLVQWASLDKDEKRFKDAEDKHLRALFIRHQLGDVKSSLSILEQLHNIYVATDNDKSVVTKKWINRLSRNDFSGWEVLYTDFDIYPQPDH